MNSHRWKLLVNPLSVVSFLLGVGGVSLRVIHFGNASPVSYVTSWPIFFLQMWVTVAKWNSYSWINSLLLCMPAQVYTPRKGTGQKEMNIVVLPKSPEEHVYWDRPVGLGDDKTKKFMKGTSDWRAMCMCTVLCFSASKIYYCLRHLFQFYVICSGETSGKIHAMYKFY